MFFKDDVEQAKLVNSGAIFHDDDEKEFMENFMVRVSRLADDFEAMEVETCPSPSPSEELLLCDSSLSSLSSSNSSANGLKTAAGSLDEINSSLQRLSLDVSTKMKGVESVGEDAESIKKECGDISRRQHAHFLRLVEYMRRREDEVAEDQPNPLHN